MLTSADPQKVNVKGRKWRKIFACWIPISECWRGVTIMAEKPEKEVVIPAGEIRLLGILGLPPEAKGAIAFAHGRGSGRLSPRNNYVARLLQEAGFATLLVDLLEESEETDRRKVFDIELLTERLLICTQWMHNTSGTRGLKIGYFGASTGAASALQAAAREPDDLNSTTNGVPPRKILIFSRMEATQGGQIWKITQCGGRSMNEYDGDEAGKPQHWELVFIFPILFARI
ncbi:MAG TPA: hypothetical protein DDY17_11420 [Syntrophaceae bacterium]|nr:hypothetical protein [Syntrophaceae bacterium]